MRAESVLSAMADTTRQRLLRVLSTQELTVSELVEIMDQPQSTLSRHLKMLRESGLVIERRVGRSVYHSAVLPSQSATEGNGQNGAGRVAALRNWLLDWVGHAELDEATGSRLESLLSRRRREPGAFFNSVGSRWDQLRIEAFGQVFHLEALTAVLTADWVVADIGTGTGYMLGVLADRFCKVIAVDPAETMLEIARHRPEVATSANIEFRQGSLSRLPIASGEVDLAIASLVLHHIEHPAEALTELARCVKPGGRLMVVEQEIHDIQEFRTRMGDDSWGFQPEIMEQLFRDAGFVDTRLRPLASARPANGKTAEVPRLFVLTGRRGPGDPRP